ncbi:MAG TPA: NrsF family protein [Solirubrobacterales bacterium]|nr:NrsF family protein [Solirubrobacterales bacterium]
MLAPDLKHRILAAAASEASPTRRQCVVRSAIRAVSALAVPLLLFTLVGGVRLTPRPLGLVALTALGTSAIAAWALFAAFGRGPSMLGRTRGWLLGTAVIAPLAFLIWKVAASSGVPHMMDPWPTRPGLRCFAVTALFAAWPLVALGWERWGSDPVHPRALGLALGVAVGAAAAVLVDLWCPVGHVPHLLTGHVAPMLLLGGVGALVGARVLGVRAGR